MKLFPFGRSPSGKVIIQVITEFVVSIKETRSATMNIFRFFFYFLIKSFVKVELSYVFHNKSVHYS